MEEKEEEEEKEDEDEDDNDLYGQYDLYCYFILCYFKFGVGCSDTHLSVTIFYQ